MDVPVHWGILSDLDWLILDSRRYFIARGRVGADDVLVRVINDSEDLIITVNTNTSQEKYRVNGFDAVRCLTEQGIVWDQESTNSSKLQRFLQDM